MKNRKLLFVSVFAVFVTLCIVARLGWNAFCEEKLATIELSSGDRIIVKYYRSDWLPAALAGTGGLKYQIY